MRVERVEPDIVRPLRHRVLRPHQSLAEQRYAGDEAPGAAHFAAWRDDPERGRGRGAGGLLLAACLEHARGMGATRVWANARSPVRGFYEHAGFAVEGEEVELPGIGPHFLMWLDPRATR